MEIYKCAVQKISLCRGTTRNCIWRLGSTLTPRPHVSKLSLTLSVSLSPGASHNTGVEQTSHRLPGDTKKFLLLWTSAFTVLFWWCLTWCYWFSVLCQGHKRSIRMRPKSWQEPCCPRSQVQPLLHKYQSLWCGALLSSYLICKALQGEVKGLLEKLSYREDSNKRRNASLIVKHWAWLIDRETDWLRDSPKHYSVEFYANWN